MRTMVCGVLVEEGDFAGRIRIRIEGKGDYCRERLKINEKEEILFYLNRDRNIG